MVFKRNDWNKLLLLLLFFCIILRERTWWYDVGEYDVISEIRNGKRSSRKWSDFRFGSTKYCTQISYTCYKFHVEVNHKQRPQQNDPTATATRRVRVQGGRIAVKIIQDLTVKLLYFVGPSTSTFNSR